MNTKDFSWANGTVDSVTTLLAERFIKRAHPPATTPTPPSQDLSTRVDALRKSMTGEDKINPIIDSLKWGLGGAGIGALVGGASSLASPNKKKRTIDDIASGAIIGGLAGTGAGTAKNMFGWPGDKQLQIAQENARAEKIVDARYARNMEGRDDPSWLGSRSTALLRAPGHALHELLYGGSKGPSEAVNTMNLFAHFTDKDIGGPITGDKWKDGFTYWPKRFSSGMPYVDWSLATLTGDLGLSALKTSGLYNDPKFLRLAANHPDIGKVINDPEKLKAFQNFLASKTDPEILKHMSDAAGGKTQNTWNRLFNPKFSMDYQITPDYLHKALNTAITDKNVLSQVPLNIDTLKSNAANLLAARMDAFTKADEPNIAAGAAHIIDNTSGTNRLINPANIATNATATDNYIKTLIKADASLAHKHGQYYRIGLRGPDLAAALHQDAVRLGGGGMHPLAIISELENLANDQNRFNMFRQGGNALKVDEASSWGAANPRGQRQQIKHPAVSTEADQVHQLARNIDDLKRFQLNLAQMAAQESNPARKEALLGLARAGEEQLKIAIKGISDPDPNKHQGWMYRGMELTPRQIRDARKLGVGAARTEAGGLKWLGWSGYGGVGTTPALTEGFQPITPPNISNPLTPSGSTWSRYRASGPSYWSQSRGPISGTVALGRAALGNTWAATRTAVGNSPRLGRGVINALGKVPRAVMYAGPIMAYNFNHNIGNRKSLFSGRVVNPYNRDMAFMATPENKPGVDYQFEQNSQALAAYLGPKNPYKALNTSDREKWEANKVISDASLTQPQKVTQLHYIFGFDGRRPFADQNFR